MGEQKTSSHDSLDAIFEYFALDAEGKGAFRRSFKNQLLAGPLFPVSYKQAFAGSLVLQREMRQIIAEVDDLIGASASASVITAGRNDGPSVALQLYAIISPGITQERLNGYENYKIMAGGIDLASGTTYIHFMEEMKARLEAYEGAKRYVRFDKAENDENARLEHRITVLKAKIAELKPPLLQPYGN
ncbi:MAG TPA: hypothetical protein VEP28_14435, partial [Rubrobacter sp.]|nr:hypothetical protein [Rubrobacter sp.]